MNEAQKKVIIKILIVLFTLLSIASIVIYILGYVNKDEIMKLIGFLSTIISPATLLGIVIKFFMNKAHMRAIDKKLNSVGLNLTLSEQAEIEKMYKDTNTKFLRVKNYVFIEKENKIIIRYNNEGLNQSEIEENFKYAFKEFIEWKRKQKESN